MRGSVVHLSRQRRREEKRKGWESRREKKKSRQEEREEERKLELSREETRARDKARRAEMEAIKQAERKKKEEESKVQVIEALGPLFSAAAARCQPPQCRSTSREDPYWCAGKLGVSSPPPMPP